MPRKLDGKQKTLLAENLYKARALNRLSREELHNLSGVATQTIVDIEQLKGNPRPYTLIKLANALNIDDYKDLLKEQ